MLLLAPASCLGQEATPGIGLCPWAASGQDSWCLVLTGSCLPAPGTAERLAGLIRRLRALPQRRRAPLGETWWAPEGAGSTASPKPAWPPRAFSFPDERSLPRPKRWPPPPSPQPRALTGRPCFSPPPTRLPTERRPSCFAAGALHCRPAGLALVPSASSEQLSFPGQTPCLRDSLPAACLA